MRYKCDFEKKKEKKNKNKKVNLYMCKYLVFKK